MIDFEKQFGKPAYQQRTHVSAYAGLFRYVYGWMCAGLVLSGVVAFYAAMSALTLRVMQGPGLWVCLLAEIGLVIALGAAIHKISAGAALAMFLGYAALNGLTLSVVFYAYPPALIGKVFFITAGMFGGLAVWGTVTKNDLSSIGSVCGMALWGLILGGIINMIWPSSGLDFALTFVGILVFSGLTMFDAKKIRAMADAEGSLDEAMMRKVGLLGALALYLDFINLFLYILRFMGRKRD